MNVELFYTVVRTAWGWCGVSWSEMGLRQSCLPRGSERQVLRTLQLSDGAQRKVCDDNGEVEAAGLLVRYFEGEDVELSVSLDLRGLPSFTSIVLREAAGVVRGEVITYGELAERAGNGDAARAVGQVMARNPLAPFVPCHRVIGSDGGLAGFGSGIELKRRLLALEGREMNLHGDGGRWVVES